MGVGGESSNAEGPSAAARVAGEAKTKLQAARLGEDTSAGEAESVFEDAVGRGESGTVPEA